MFIFLDSIDAPSSNSPVHRFSLKALRANIHTIPNTTIINGPFTAKDWFGGSG